MAISPGGVREALFSHNYELLWNKRQGFAKVALDSKAVSINLDTAINKRAHRNSFY